MTGIPLLIIGFYGLFPGQFEILEEPMFYFGVILALGYFISAYFLITLEGKAIHRRLYSWLQSFIFHYCIFMGAAVYLYYSNKDIEALVLLSPEVLVGTLSLIGYFVSRQGQGKNHA